MYNLISYHINSITLTLCNFWFVYQVIWKRQIKSYPFSGIFSPISLMVALQKSSMSRHAFAFNVYLLLIVGSFFFFFLNYGFKESNFHRLLLS